MPRITSEWIGLAFDMSGCPNRCRHCWLGPAGNCTLSEEDVRDCVARFRKFMGRSGVPIRKLKVATWFREPDYSDDYRQLYALEAELSDGDPRRYELLSVWRLARDDGYARWAKSIGPDTCQISLFGMRETNDWFHRRRGAFDDAIEATWRLLDAGIKPRWQLFLTTRLIPDLPEILDLIDHHRLRERTAELGKEFPVFLHLPGPDHEARRIEHLRPGMDQVLNLPEALLAPTRKYFKSDRLWATEATFHNELRAECDAHGFPADALDELWFYVCGNWDVFANVGTLEPWWCLGNLIHDDPEEIFRRFEREEILGLQSWKSDPPAMLAEAYGDPEGQRIYSTGADLLSLYRAKHCEVKWNERTERART